MNHEGAVEKDRHDAKYALGSLGEEVEFPADRKPRHFPPEARGLNRPRFSTFADLYEHAKSLRTMLGCYWTGFYFPDEERLIEDAISPDERYKYKPCQ